MELNGRERGKRQESVKDCSNIPIASNLLISLEVLRKYHLKARNTVMTRTAGMSTQ